MSASATGGRVLVVEDFPALRTLMTRVLTMAGHQVEQAEGVEEALRLAESASFDLLVADFDVVGGTGMEVARRAVELHPALRVLIVSGNPRGALDLELAPGTAVAFLPKPFGIDDLTARASELLGHDRPERHRRRASEGQLRPHQGRSTGE